MNYRVLHLADLERFLELRMEFLLSYQDVPEDFQNLTAVLKREKNGDEKSFSFHAGGRSFQVF